MLGCGIYISKSNFKYCITPNFKYYNYISLQNFYRHNYMYIKIFETKKFFKEVQFYKNNLFQRTKEDLKKVGHYGQKIVIRSNRLCILQSFFF